MIFADVLGAVAKEALEVAATDWDHPLKITYLLAEDLCKRLWCLRPHSLQAYLLLHSSTEWPLVKQLKHRWCFLTMLCCLSTWRPLNCEH